MSVQSPYGTSSWAFWPVGDRYSLTPKWSEHHADTDSTVRPQDEKNRLDLVGDYGASEITFTMQLRDMKDPKVPIIPTEIPNVFAVVEKVEGWMEERDLTPEVILDDDLEWTGDLKFDVTPLRGWLGYNNPVAIRVDAEFPTDAPQRLRIGYGTLVLRR